MKKVPFEAIDVSTPLSQNLRGRNLNDAPCFLVHAFNDTTVDQRNHLLFYQALGEKKIPSSLHIFPQGGCAIALRNNPESMHTWVSLCETWLLEMNFIPVIK